MLNVLLAGRPSDLSRCQIDALAELLDGRCGALTVAAVPSRVPLITRFASLAGVSYKEVTDAALEKAVRAAQELTTRLPKDLRTRHCAVGGWSELHALADQHDLVLIAGDLDRRLRRLARLAGAKAIALAG